MLKNLKHSHTKVRLFTKFNKMSISNSNTMKIIMKKENLMLSLSTQTSNNMSRLKHNMHL